MIVNLKCGECGHIYDSEVGELSINENLKLVFENKNVCPKCKAEDKGLLTEKGQSQMTDWHLGNI
jgi:rubredoxin